MKNYLTNFTIVKNWMYLNIRHVPHVVKNFKIFVFIGFLFCTGCMKSIQTIKVHHKVQGHWVTNSVEVKSETFFGITTYYTNSSGFGEVANLAIVSAARAGENSVHI